MRRRAPALLLVVAVSAIVAMTATGAGLFVAPVPLGQGLLRAIRVVAGVAALGGLAVLVVRGAGLRSRGDPESDTTGGSLGAAAVIMGVIALMAWLAPGPRSGSEPGLETGAPSEQAGESRGAATGTGLVPPWGGRTGAGEGAGSRGPGQGTGDRLAGQSGAGNPAGDYARSAGDLLRRVGTLLMLLLLVFAAVFGIRTLGGRAAQPPPDPEAITPIAAVAAEAGLMASLGDVSFEGKDPRGQITVAYRRLLAALAAAGAPREPQEAPYEYLLRALGPLGVRAEPMHTLTGLYVMAEFSDHPVTEHRRARAVEALEAGLLGLRTASAANPAPESQPVPEAVRG